MSKIKPPAKFLSVHSKRGHIVAVYAYDCGFYMDNFFIDKQTVMERIKNLPKYNISIEEDTKALRAIEDMERNKQMKLPDRTKRTHDALRAGLEYLLEEHRRHEGLPVQELIKNNINRIIAVNDLSSAVVWGWLDSRMEEEK